MVNIIQTINYIESYEHANIISNLISDSGVNGIRVNLCKYSRDIVRTVIREFIPIFLRKGIRKIYLDIPYPIDKARIYGILNDKKVIKENDEYLIKKGNNSDSICDYESKKIYVNCTKFDVNRDIVYYGDGEGAFRVSRISEKGIFCVAKNDFYIINGKSISCGYFEQDKAVMSNILDSIGDMEVSLLIPFTESVDVINDIRGMVHNNVSLIAKIETESGMNNIEEIARKAEGILIGRGDLALYSNLKDLFPNLRDAIEKVRENKIIFCTGILQNFSDAYMPERAEISDLMLIKQLYANELILSGSSDFNFSNIRELYLHSLKSIKRKVGFINNVW